MFEVIQLSTSQREQFLDITSKVEDVVSRSGISSGLCLVYSPHTTAAVVINESADRSVMMDIMGVLRHLVPSEGKYLHTEGNSDAHIKATLTGSSRSVIIDEGRLRLGRWQGIFFCEFDGPRSRQVYVKVFKF